MGLLAARHPANWEESRTSARRGNEIRERESSACARLVGPGLVARAGGLLDPAKLPVVGVEQARKLVHIAVNNGHPSQTSVNELQGPFPDEMQ